MWPHICMYITHVVYYVIYNMYDFVHVHMYTVQYMYVHVHVHVTATSFFFGYTRPKHMHDALYRSAPTSDLSQQTLSLQLRKTNATHSVAFTHACLHAAGSGKFTLFRSNPEISTFSSQIFGRSFSLFVFVFASMLDMKG